MEKDNKYLKVIITIIGIALILALSYIAYHYIGMFLAEKEAKDAADNFENEVIVVAVDGDENEGIVEIQNQENTETQSQPNLPASNSTRNASNRRATTTYKGYSVLGTIQIPKTKVKSVVVDKITPKSISAAVAILYGPGLNEVGNTVLVAHNYRNGTFFSNNQKLTNGDKIYITNQAGIKVEYEVYKSYITSDTDISYATRNTNRKT